MPTYTFEIIETGEQYDEVMKIAEKDDYLKNNPKIKPVMTAPHFVGDHNTPLADRFSRRSAKDIKKENIVKKYNLKDTF